MRRQIPESARRESADGHGHPSFPGPWPASAERTQAFGGHGYANPHLIPHSVILPGPPGRGQNPKSAVSPGSRGHQPLIPWGPAAPSTACPRHALTQLPAAHVIELCAEKQGGDDVNDREDDPERCVPFTKDLEGRGGGGVCATGRAEEALRRAAPPARPSSGGAELAAQSGRLSGEARGRHLREGAGISPSGGGGAGGAGARTHVHLSCGAGAARAGASPRPARRRR